MQIINQCNYNGAFNTYRENRKVVWHLDLTEKIVDEEPIVLDTELYGKVFATLNNHSAINIQMNFWFNEMMKYHGASYAEYRALRLLIRYPDGIEPSVIADTLTILRQYVTKMVDDLEKRNLVERVPHPTDRRRIYIRLTPEGLSLTKILINEMNIIVKNIFLQFSKEEMENYLDIRTRIIKKTEDEIKKRYVEKSE